MAFKLGEEFKNLLKNELKTLIVTDEIKPTNEYIDDKQVYIKRLDVGQLATLGNSKTVNTGLDLSQITIQKIAGIARTSTNNTIALNSSYARIYIGAGTGNIAITSEVIDLTSYNGEIDIYFTYNE